MIFDKETIIIGDELILEKDFLYDITFIDIPVKNFLIENDFVQKLNSMYALSDTIFKIKTGYRFEEKKYYYSSGILCLSSYLKEKKFKVGYLNLPKDLDKLKKYIMSSRFIGFSTVTITVLTILNLAKKIKKWNPQIKILLGGYHVSYCAKELLENHKYIDYIIVGEGELPILQVLYGVDNNKIKGLCYVKGKGEIVINTEKHFLHENEIPVPDFSLLGDEIENYNIYIGTMRGCVGKCNFCINHNYWEKPRYIAYDKLEESFRYLYERINDRRLIHIIDNVFTLNENRLKEFYDVVKLYNKKFIFECDTLANLVNKEKIKLLNDINVVKIGLGFEDCDDSITKLANKSVTFSDNVKAAKLIRKYSPNNCIYAYWLIGLPGSSLKSINKNIEMIKYLISNEIVHIISPKIFIPYPGTVFWNESEKYDLNIVSKNWDDYERVSPPYPYYLKNISENQLEKTFQKVVNVCIREYLKKWNLELNDLQLYDYTTWYKDV